MSAAQHKCMDVRYTKGKRGTPKSAWMYSWCGSSLEFEKSELWWMRATVAKKMPSVSLEETKE